MTARLSALLTAALALALLAPADAATANREDATRVLRSGDRRLRIEVLGPVAPARRDELQRWLAEAAGATLAAFGRFPLGDATVRVEQSPSRSRSPVPWGQTLRRDDVAVLLYVREDASLDELRGDWTAGLADGQFDLVVANPPYIATEVIETLEPEVRDHDPRLALDGGADGLDAYRLLAPEILRVLKPTGRFVVEIGYDQKDAVEALFKAAGAVLVETIRDLADRDRVVVGEKKPLETAG